MTARLFRVVVVLVLTLGLFVNRPVAQEPANDSLEGIVVEDSSFGYKLYRPRPVVWPVPDILLSAYMIRWTGPERRRLFLVVRLNGVEDELLSPLIVAFDGTAVRLNLADHPDIDRSGCVPAAVQTIQDEDNLLRRISMARHVQVAYEAPNILLHATLMLEDLDRLRRIVALHDMAGLPPDLPPPKDEVMAPPAGFSNPTLIASTKVPPRYPRKAIVKEKSGQVVLSARVLKDGSVGDMRPFSPPAQSCGFAEAAMEAVKQWKYTPATMNGEPVDANFTIIVNFVLDKPPDHGSRHHRPKHRD